jgi:alpha-amylase/alpha-mannosidase (GH57 family)
MTRVAILWHMHQPFYEDLFTREHVLPWVRLHALKDYWGMVALLDEFPSVRVTFNLVPSLLVQLEAFAGGTARDRHLELGLKPAAQLTEEERGFCVEQFFHAHRPRMIDPYPRYRELLDQRGSGVGGPRAQASRFSTDDVRDLQVWHKLVWVDASYHDHDSRVRALVQKGRAFTEDNKATLRAVELEILRKVIREYAAAAARGQVELSTSPFYHPILPLLCDSDVHLRMHPQAIGPREAFRHPEDAAEQLARAAALHERLFGARPRGLWPSEGSVSEAIVPLVGKAGFHWMATDEEILARSLGLASFTRGADGHVSEPERLYRPYRVGPVACGFRDHTLSDLIGFTYASWSADRAAEDFVGRLVMAGRGYAARTGGEEATVFVILDGENAWEYYDGQGRPFLRALYGRLAANPEIRTVTMGEACAGAADTLPSLAPGSWINGDFYIWIGHADDQRAWSQLAEARRALDAAASSATPEALDRAREEVLIAEGSDWFWWYGDDHSSEHDLVFDDLFRRHLRNLYRTLDRAVPEELFVTNITTAPPRLPIAPPTGFIRPTIDGAVTDYFEWIGAGGVDAGGAGGTMQQAGNKAGMVALVEYGFDLQHLYVRVDAVAAARDLLRSGIEVRVRFLEPGGLRVAFRTAGGDVEVLLERRPAGDTDWRPVECPDLAGAVDQVVEARIPFTCLNVKPRERVAFLVSVMQGDVELELHPRQGPIQLAVPDTRFSIRNWRA